MSTISIGIGHNMSGMHGMARNMQMSQVNNLVKAMDSDSNGSLNVDEFQSAVADRFSASDTNGDEVLSGEELQQAMVAFLQQLGSGINGISRPGEPPSAEDMLGRMDQDDNGTISVDEARGPLAERFTAADSDSDGQVTLSELQDDMTAFQAERPAQGSGMQGMGGRHGGPHGAGGAGMGPPPGGMAGGQELNKEDSDKAALEAFSALDTNQDGEVSAEELMAAGQVSRSASAYASSRLGTILQMLFTSQQDQAITVTV